MENTAPAGIKRLGQTGLFLGILGLIGLLIAFLITPREQAVSVLHAYHYAWLLGAIYTFGCYGFMMLAYLMRARWAKPVLRLFESGAKMLPVMLGLFLPILFNLSVLYPWADPQIAHSDHHIERRAAWMNPTMFWIRTFLYFGISYLYTHLLTRSSLRQDRTGDHKEEIRRQRYASVGFPVFIITMTLASADWFMSLEKYWFSTLLGFMFVDYCGLAAISLVSLVVTNFKLSRTEPYASKVTPDTIKDLGNLSLMLTMVWAYFALSQWLIIYSGNIPEETSYYLVRNKGWLLAIGAFNVIGSFFMPFLLLLNGYHRRSPGMLRALAFWLTIMRIVDLYWVVMPTMRVPISVMWYDFVALLTIGGFWIAGFCLWLSRYPVITSHEVTEHHGHSNSEVAHHA